MEMTIEEKENLIAMFREQIFPSQARTLLKQNFEGKGELDKQEYLRDTTILLDLAEKGLQVELIKANYEARLKADMAAMLEDLRLDIEEMEHCITSFSNDTYISYNDTWQKIQEYINALGGGENEKHI